jgi:hypothetical protein
MKPIGVLQAILENHFEAYNIKTTTSKDQASSM